MGIPIGPDTSLLLAEILTTAIDSEIQNKLGRVRGFRFIDDYFLCFKKSHEAEHALSALNQALAKYELNINDQKTEILGIDAYHEPTWAHELSQIKIENSAAQQRRSIQHLFDTALKLGRIYPDDSVIKLTIRFSQAYEISFTNWDLYFSYLLRCAIAQPNCMDLVCETIYSYVQEGYPLEKDVIQEFVEDVVCLHAPLQNHSEVAWALWMSKILSVPLSAQAADSVGQVISSVCALLALDLHQCGLTTGKLNTDEWAQYLSAKDLYGELWLLAYEAPYKGWLAPSTKYITKDPYFSLLYKADVYFYDESVTPNNIFAKKMKKARKKPRELIPVEGTYSQGANFDFESLIEDLSWYG